MKKLFVVALVGMLSACACFDCKNDIPTRIRMTNNAKLDCDYFDGRTCYRYVYKKPDHPIVRPEPVRYRKCRTVRPACNTCNTCEDKVSEVREPVEVVYKKTTYKTVCDPKTVSQVSYETVPYDEAPIEEK